MNFFVLINLVYISTTLGNTNKYLQDMRKHALKLVNHVVQFIGIFCINKFSIYISTTLGNTNKYLKDMRKHALKPVNHTYPKKKKKPVNHVVPFNGILVNSTTQPLNFYGFSIDSFWKKTCYPTLISTSHFFSSKGNPSILKSFLFSSNQKLFCLIWNLVFLLVS